VYGIVVMPPVLKLKVVKVEFPVIKYILECIGSKSPPDTLKLSGEYKVLTSVTKPVLVFIDPALFWLGPDGDALVFVTMVNKLFTGCATIKFMRKTKSRFNFIEFFECNYLFVK
jgi:hypothetical protein